MGSSILTTESIVTVPPSSTISTTSSISPDEVVVYTAVTVDPIQVGLSQDKVHKREQHGTVSEVLVVVVETETVVQATGREYDPAVFSYNPSAPDWKAIPTLGSRDEITVVVIEESGTLAPETFTKTSFTFDPAPPYKRGPSAPDWKTIQTLGNRDAVTVVIIEENSMTETFTETSFTFEPTPPPVTVVIVEESSTTETFTETSFAFEPTKPPRDKRGATQSSSLWEGHDAEPRSSYGSVNPFHTTDSINSTITKAPSTSHVTCTPIVVAQPNSEPTPMGCIGPQSLITSEFIMVAETTMTVAASQWANFPSANNGRAQAFGLNDEMRSFQATSNAVSVSAVTGLTVVAVSLITALLAI